MANGNGSMSSNYTELMSGLPLHMTMTFLCGGY